MHFVVRAACLFIGGLVAVAVCVLLGMLFDLWGLLTFFEERFWEMFWERMRAFPSFKVVIVATMLSMLFPTSYYGMNVLDRERYSRSGWGNAPAFEVFILTSMLIFSLIVVFQPEDEILRIMSRKAYILPFFLLCWVHGGINAYHVHVLSRNFRDEL